MTYVFLGFIFLICILSFIAASNNKESHGLVPSFICVGILSVVLALFTFLDTITNNLLLAQANAVGEAKVLAIRQEAVKLGLATFKATPDGKEVIFVWVCTNPVEKPLTNPK